MRLQTAELAMYFWSLYTTTRKLHARGHPGGGGGYSQKNWVGVCGPLPKNPTLFMTKNCDIPYPIYALPKIRNLIYDLFQSCVIIVL